MQDHTKKGLEKVWNEQFSISRAKRAGSSAPSPEELDVYRNSLLRALVGRPEPRALILGATPELRDLAIDLGCKTMAVDISQPLLDSMQEAMKHKNHPKNQEICGDWLSMRQYFDDHSFDVVMGDASLNNVPVGGHSKLLADLAALLKPGGYIIVRHFIHNPSRPQGTIADWQRIYNEGKTYWIMFYYALSLYTDWREQVYDFERKEVNVRKVFELTEQAMARGELKFRPEDIWKVNNVLAHGRGILHIVFSKEEFLSLVKEHFVVEAIEASPAWEYLDSVPIFVFRAPS